MDKDSFKAVATAAAVGLGLAGIAIHASPRKAKTGREPWNPKTDFTEYDYIIVGGQCLCFFSCWQWNHFLAGGGIIF
jgi:hypothetical protein